MGFVEPGQRPRRVALLNAGAVEDAGKMPEILEPIAKQPRRGFGRLFLEDDMFGGGDGEADEFDGIGHGILLGVPGAR